MKSFNQWLCSAAALAVVAGAANAAPSSVETKPFGTVDGKQVQLYTLTNSRGLTVKITNYGGIVTSILAPDRNGKLGEVVLGYDDVDGYVNDPNGTYFGALIGRYANRIARGKFTLDGKTYHLAINNPPNTLHGGKQGFDKRIWTAMPFKSGSGVGVKLAYTSADGEENFPGKVNLNVAYTLANDGSLKIAYRAVTSKDTVVNFTNHTYFNLNGAGSGTILNHQLTLNANRFTPIDATSIPTGVLQPVAGTPFDFRSPHVIGERINANDVQIKNGSGYDHNFVVNGRGLRMSARVYSPLTGRVLEEYTTEPGVQLYTGNFLNGKNVGHGDKAYPKRSGFCLEAQHFPDSPNHPKFPTTELKPGQIYHQTTIYKFSAR